MLVKFYKVSINMSLYTSVSNCIQEIPDQLKTQEMCAEAVHIKLYSLEMRFRMMQCVQTHTRRNLFLIVKLNYKKCGMRNLIKMVILLKGTMAINNAQPRKHKN